MEEPTIEYNDGINSVEITMLNGWFKRYFDGNYMSLLEAPRMLVSCTAERKVYTIQASIDDCSLRPCIMFCRNKTCLEKRFISKDYCDIDKAFIELLVMLKKTIRKAEVDR